MRLELLDRRFLPLTNGPVANARIAMLGRLLRPHRASGVRKVRLGGSHDGGYVCLDDFNEMAGALSLGVGRDSTWDAAIADRGLIVYQYDHTITAPPTVHANFRFNRRKIAADADGESESIESILANNRLSRSHSVIMKIDIEHDEWPAFAATPADALDKFAQVICEFHGFERVTDDQWFGRAFNVLKKLNDRFSVVHVHANNYGPILAIGNLLFPSVLEVTYANKAKYVFEDTDETFPGALDAPNLAAAPDYELGRFVF